MTEPLTAEEIGRVFWSQMFPGIRLRWNPALVAKMAKVHEGHRWQEEPQWLRIMPMLTTWHIIEDLCGGEEKRRRS